jgi:antimicrobial peptide system SdpB family protein
MFKLNYFGQWVDRISSSFTWTNTYGIARSLLALGTLLTLAFNDINLLMKPMGTFSPMAEYRTMTDWSIFYLLPNHLELAKWICIGILFLVLIGWRPRFTAIFHWWITFSYASSAMLIDGGDQVTQIMTLFLIPICLIDNRKWHWSTKAEKAPKVSRKMMLIVALSCFFMIRVQVALVYFHAGVGKLPVEEWSNGTALYYWLSNPNFGLTDGLQAWILPLFTHPVVVTFVTWGVLLLEIFLFLGIAISKRWRPYLLVAGLTFHFGIIVVHGLVSFFFAMAGALVLYLGPIDTGIKLKKPVINWSFFKSRKKLDWKQAGTKPVLAPELARIKK